MGSQTSKKEDTIEDLTINFHEIQSKISARISNERRIVFQVSKDNNKHIVTPSTSSHHILDSSYHSNIQSQKSRGLTCTVRSYERKQSNTNRVWKKKFVVKRMNITSQNQRIFKHFMEFTKLSESKILVQQNTKRNMQVSQLVGFHRQSDNFMCGGTQFVYLIFQEWGSYTLLDEIKLRKSQIFSQTLNSKKQRNCLTKRVDYSFKINQIIKIANFLIETAEQFLIFRQNCLFPMMNLNDILLLQKFGNDINMKYRHPLDSILFYEREFQRNYCNSADYLYNHNPKIFQSNMILQIGLCLLSLALLQDCNQSCFSSSGQICKSQLQNKIQQFYQIYQRMYQPEIVRCVSQIIHLFIFQAIQDKLMRIYEAKSKLNKSSISARSLLIKNFSSTIECSSSDSSYLSWGSKNVSKKVNQNNDKRMLKVHNKQNLEEREELKKKRSIVNPLGLISRINMTSEQQRTNNGKDYLSLTKIKNSKQQWNIEQSSQRKVIEINNTLQPRTRQWMIEDKNQLMKQESKQKKACYDDIDKKWSQNQDLFKEMPDFWNLPNSNSQFRQFGGSSLLSMIPLQNSTLI